MSAAGRFCRTVVRLRPRQVWTRVSRVVARPRAGSGPAPERTAPSGALAQPIAREDGWFSPTRVRLLNVERDFGGGIDWHPADETRLWVYTLNYFSDLPRTRLTPEQAAGLIDSWIAANRPGSRDSWDPYPTSIRIVSWVKWLLLAEGPADADVLDSLAAQLRYLERRIEFDIAANHLMANAVALAVGGLFFGDADGDRWANRGFALLFSQIDEQVLDDGGHYERSPMYHAVVLEQLLDVLNVWNIFPDEVPGRWHGRRDRIERVVLSMFDWLSAMTHPDGDTSFFNDSTTGSAATLEELVAYAHRLGLKPGSSVFAGITRLESSGFFRMHSNDRRSVLLFDVGGPEPGHQPGHAHAESLSFELSRDGRRVFVNSGVSTYEPGSERTWQRSTAAHNTVRVDEAEQSELWASHRCGRRARVRDAGVRDTCAHAEHTGYRHRPGRAVHRREVCVSDVTVEIVDKIGGEGEHLLEWFFHLHPDVTAEVRDRGVELLRDGVPLASLAFPFGASATVSSGSWHPAFGGSVANSFIHVALRASLPFESHATIRWS